METLRQKQRYIKMIDYVELLDLFGPIMVAAITALLVYLRTRYAGLGDTFFQNFKKIVDSLVALEPLYPDIHDLNVKLLNDYDKMYKIWATGEISGWTELMGLVADFFSTYVEIQNIIAKIAPKPVPVTAGVK